ncbi:MAG: CAP domain-containing protein [Microbacterium sp.]
MTSRLRRRFGVAAAAVSAFALLLSGTATPALAADTSTLSCTSLTLAQVQDQILSEVNADRAALGLTALQRDTTMDAVAVAWSQSQAAASTMSHNPNYTSQIPSGWTAAGENVAYGYAPTAVTTAWLNSAGHRANIESTLFTHIGIGVACSASGTPYYTQDFGAYSSSAAVALGSLTAATPAITGTVAVGEKLTAKVGTWNPTSVVLTYRWLRGGVAISGATGKTYKLTAADAGKKISVRVTGTKSGYTTTTVTSAAKKVPKVLTKTTTPKITGTKKVGKKLTAAAGTWKPSGVTLSYQWLRGGVAISGATGKTYKLTAADAGKKISVRVTGTKSGYTSVSRTSTSYKITKK